MTTSWRRSFHLFSVTALFIVISASVVWLIYAAILLYGVTGYAAVTAVVWFLLIWTWFHKDLAVA